MGEVCPNGFGLRGCGNNTLIDSRGISERYSSLVCCQPCRDHSTNGNTLVKRETDSSDGSVVLRKKFLHIVAVLLGGLCACVACQRERSKRLKPKCSAARDNDVCKQCCSRPPHLLSPIHFHLPVNAQHREPKKSISRSKFNACRLCVPPLTTPAVSPNHIIGLKKS